MRRRPLILLCILTALVLIWGIGRASFLQAPKEHMYWTGPAPTRARFPSLWSGTTNAGTTQAGNVVMIVTSSTAGGTGSPAGPAGINYTMAVPLVGAVQLTGPPVPRRLLAVCYLTCRYEWR